MNIKSFKYWHWMIIGLPIGILVGTIRLMSEMEQPLGGRGFITQKLFEQALQTPPVDGHPYVTNIFIRPYHGANGIDLVALHAIDQETGRYKEYLFAAPRPFAPSGAGPPREDYSVRDYLSTLSATNPALAPRYAWWEATPIGLAFYGLLGIAVIGGGWPTILRFLNGPESKEKPYDLDRFHHDAEAPKPAPAHGPQHLRELEEEMERAPGPGSEIEAVPPPPTLPIRQLSNVPLAPLVSTSDDMKKEFDGEFYPVEKHAPHGFSLVELIVVIGIIALLAGFLMPALRLARMNAQTTKCAAQLRDIGQALHAYAAANHDSLPAWSDWHTWPSGLDSDTYGPAWTIELIPYIGNPDSPVYNCPSFPLAQNYRNYFLESQWSGRCGRSSMKLSEITMSSRFVLSGDTTNMGHYTSDVRMDDADPDDFGGGMLLWPWTGGPYMHHGGNNVLFDDGHVVLFSRYDKYQMTFNPHRMQDHDEVTPD